MNPKDKAAAAAAASNEPVKEFKAGKSAADLQKELDAAHAEIAALKEEVAKLKLAAGSS